MPSLFVQSLILLALLLLSGFFSSAETALFSISRTRAIHLAKSNDRISLLILRMKAEPHRLLSTILIGNNIVNVGASAFATSVALGFFPDYAVGIATGMMTFLILVFGEVLPKSLATQNNLRIARAVIYPVYWLSILFWPIVIFLNFIPRITGRMKKSPPATEAELKTFVEVVEEEGEIKEEERELIHNVFEFDDTSASEIMTPRGDMFVVPIDAELNPEAIVASGFTRIPVIDGEIDHVVGIANVKDLFLAYLSKDQPIDLRSVMVSPYFVPENMKLDKLLKEFKRRKHHMAIIVDEHGGVSGLITLEDALEELVGEIADETDKEEPLIVDSGDGQWMVLGKSSIEDVNDAIPMNIPDIQDYDTFSGYVLHVIGRIPTEKERIDLGAFEAVVEEKDGNRINRYRVSEKNTKGAMDERDAETTV